MHLIGRQLSHRRDLRSLDRQIRTQQVCGQPRTHDLILLERQQSLMQTPRKCAGRRTRRRQRTMNTIQPCPDQRPQSQPRIRRSIRRPELQVSLLRPGSQPRNPQHRLTISATQPGAISTPVPRPQPEIRDNAGRRKSQHRRRVLDDPRRKRQRNLGQATVPISSRFPVASPQAEMNMRPAHRPAAWRRRSEGSRSPRQPGNSAGNLPKQNRPVCSNQPLSGPNRHLPLLPAELRQPVLRLKPSPCQCSDQLSPERLRRQQRLHAKRMLSGGRIRTSSRKDKLMLKGSRHDQPGVRFQLRERTAQRTTRAALPRSSISVPQVPKRQANLRPGRRQRHSRTGISPDVQVAKRAKRVIGQVTERRDPEVSRHPPHSIR
jgi:hypothetical protein